MIKVKVDSGSFAPERAYKTDAGADLRSPICVKVPAHDSVIIDTGVHIELPDNTAGFLKSKSGLMCKYGVTSEGVIDVGYTGSIRVKLFNHSCVDHVVLRGDKISQLVIVKVDIEDFDVVQELDQTERGDNGFGSTGR